MENDVMPVPLLEPKQKPVKPKKRNLTKTSFSGVGRPRVLNLQERVEVWKKYCLGTSIFDLSIEYRTNPSEIMFGLELMAKELGFPDRHLDPELERFRIVQASEQMKVAVIQCLDDSNKTLKDLDARLATVKKKLGKDNFSEEDLRKYLKIIETRQNEKSVVAKFLAEFRTINTAIADLAGVRKSKPVAPPKKGPDLHKILDAMTDDEIRELANSKVDKPEIIDIEDTDAETDNEEEADRASAEGSAE